MKRRTLKQRGQHYWVVPDALGYYPKGPIRMWHRVHLQLAQAAPAVYVAHYYRTRLPQGLTTPVISRLRQIVEEEEP